MPRPVMLITLQSRDFEQKVLLGLNTTNAVIVPCRFELASNEESLNKISFVVFNSRSSNLKHCFACDGKHYFFVKDFEPERTEKSCLCSSCVELMQVMVVMGCDKNRIKEWAQSRGSVNPHDLIRDTIEKKISSGEIKTEMRNIDIDTSKGDDN